MGMGRVWAANPVWGGCGPPIPYAPPPPPTPTTPPATRGLPLGAPKEQGLQDGGLPANRIRLRTGGHRRGAYAPGPMGQAQEVVASLKGGTGAGGIGGGLPHPP